MSKSVSSEPEQVLSVAELAQRLRRAVESLAGNEWVEGEITDLKRAASGHVYFTLKDERQDAAVDCALYRHQALRNASVWEAGARVQIRGKPTVWAPRGKLQFIVERMRLAGRGALLEALEKLKQRLAAEGLFSPERKRPLPTEPRLIGVVTSRAGAAWRDIAAVAFRRGPAHLLVASALVQGEEAPQRLIMALDLVERHPALDVIIIGRGGGSGEDLMAFNDERLVRRVAATRVPVVSAVGHDIDFTLTDLVADVRAATPSEAAERVVQDESVRLSRLATQRLAVASAIRARLAEDRDVVRRLRLRITDPRFILAAHQQRLDETWATLGGLGRALARRARGTTEPLSNRLVAQHPTAVLGRARRAAERNRVRLHGEASRTLERAKSRLVTLMARLEALSPLAVLGRGYAIARRLDGRAIRGPDEIAIGEPFHLHLSEGELLAEVKEKDGGTQKVS